VAKFLSAKLGGCYNPKNFLENGKICQPKQESVIAFWPIHSGGWPNGDLGQFCKMKTFNIQQSPLTQELSR